MKGNRFDYLLVWCQIGTMPRNVTNAARVVARVPEQIRETIQLAADLTGASLNQFLVQTAYKEARQILEKESLVRFSEAQARQVFDLLENPPAPNARLNLAAERVKSSGCA